MTVLIPTALMVWAIDLSYHVEETGVCVMLTEILLCSIVTLPLVFTIYENNIRIISK